MTVVNLIDLCMEQRGGGEKRLVPEARCLQVHIDNDGHRAVVDLTLMYFVLI